MRFLTWHRAQIVFTFHILQESDDTPDFRDHRYLQPTDIIVFNESPQPFVDEVFDLRSEKFALITV
jgi:hypothetical protein